MMTASSSDLSGLMKFLSRDVWRECFEEIFDAHVGAVLRASEMDFEDLAAMLGEQHAMTLWGCAFEDFLTQDFDVDGVNIIDDYLKRRSWKEGPKAKAYMKALRRSVMSLYEVSEIVPGVSFKARDLLRGGEPVTVSEATATTMLAPWEKLGARIVTVMNKRIMASGALVFSDDSTKVLGRSLCDALGKRKTKALPLLTDDELGDVASLFTLTWLGSTLDMMLSPKRPTLANMDGDEIVFHDVRFPLAAGTEYAKVAARLNTVKGLVQENDSFWNWLQTAQRQAGGNPGAKSMTQSTAKASHALDTALDTGARVLGNLTLTDAALTLSTNSAARARTGTEMIKLALAEMVGNPLTRIHTVEQMMAERPARGREIPKLDVPPEAVSALLHSHMDEHYRKTLDQPVHMLGGKTPRQAVKTAAGKTKVVEWLKYLERQSAAHDPSDPMASYEFGGMWDELGVRHLRK
jgi:hypothetical protein